VGRERRTLLLVLGLSALALIALSVLLLGLMLVFLGQR
jgi:hypothetical protein